MIETVLLGDGSNDKLRSARRSMWKMHRRQKRVKNYAK